ncbi:MAG: adenylate/guanylate cyclase domain-containing protein [Rhodospirillales bacterium]
MTGPRLRGYLRLILVVLAFACPGGALYGVATGGQNWGHDALRGVITALFISICIAVFEISLATHGKLAWLRQAPFALVLLARTLVYLAIIVVGLEIGRVAVGDPGSLFALNPAFKMSVAFSLAASLVFNFINQIARILGRGVLGSLVLGRYHRPRSEERLFLLVDMKDSTSIAERIGDLAFHNLLNDFFATLAQAVNAVGGDIHKFIGDEAIAVWQPKRGLRNAACLTCFFDFGRRLAADAEYYRSTYGVLPQFHGGAHIGTVIVGEMGSTKQEIAYSGAALNTAARIEQATRQFGQSLLVSDVLLSRLALPAELSAQSVGRITLRGSAEEIELFAVSSPSC